MADRRQRVKQGLGAVLRSTTQRAPETEAEQGADQVAEESAEAAQTRARGRSGGEPRSYTRIAPPEPVDAKRHTSVYLHATEFEMLDDMIYALRKEHGMRIPKTELWRALLHLASGMLQDPDRVDELLVACGGVLEE